ncbi:ricin B-like lectin R40C1 [Ananas comosus]|uniref:Ricin B-like lectin R40C1 n=1 Tax=Ananas comosus TaxID=4615 RepID=A0A6P5GJE3_ANACO|nr:ricin B-like lectin R40C1 [Ananas comosus]
MRYSAKVKDEDGKPAFALVNKATGEALKHSFGFGHYVRLIPYNPGYLDESVLWTESDDLGGGFHTIRMVNNTGLLFDSLNSSGGVSEGNPLGLWKWNEGDNQRWKIVPYFLCPLTLLLLIIGDCVGDVVAAFPYLWEIVLEML